MEKKLWIEPTLEVLDVAQTFGGPNGAVPDSNGKGANNRHKPNKPNKPTTPEIS